MRSYHPWRKTRNNFERCSQSRCIVLVLCCGLLSLTLQSAADSLATLSRFATAVSLTVRLLVTFMLAYLVGGMRYGFCFPVL